MDKNEIRTLSEQRIFTLEIEEVSFLSFDYAFGKAREVILAKTNLTEIPDELKYTFVDMTVGYLLQAQRFGNMRIKGKEINSGESPVKSITEGDVSIAFASGSDSVKSPEKMYEELVESLINQPDELFYRFRRLLW